MNDVCAPDGGPFESAAIRAIALDLKARDGALLPILHAVQARFGYIDRRAIPVIADVLNLSRAEVQGVVSFYHDFRQAPAGRHVIKICQAEACQALGATRLARALEAHFGVPLGATAADGRVTLEAVYCLGNCALSPAALVDGKLCGRFTVERAAELVHGGGP